MLNKQRISNIQFLILVLTYTVGSAILYTPGLLVSKAKQDGWIAGIVGIMIGILLVFLYNRVGNKISGSSFYEYNKYLFGKFLGKIVFLVFIITFPFLIGSLLLRSVGDFMTTQIMPETPIHAIHILFMIIVIFGTRLGLETILRALEIFAPWIVGLFVLFMLFLLPQAEITKIQPVFEGGIKPIIGSAFPFVAFPFFEIMILVMLFPYVNQKKGLNKAMYIGTLIGGVMLVLITLVGILVLGADITSRHTFPTYTLGKLIKIGDFLQRIEVIVAIMWFLTMYFKLTILFYLSCYGLKQVLGLKDYKVLTFPLGMILIILSLVIGTNIVELNEFTSTIWPIHAIVFGLIYPIVLLVMDKLRQQISKNSTQKGTVDSQ
jgi:spore germination protein KB